MLVIFPAPDFAAAVTRTGEVLVVPGSGEQIVRPIVEAVHTGGGKLPVTVMLTDDFFWLLKNGAAGARC